MVTKAWLSFCVYMSAEQAVAMQNHRPLQPLLCQTHTARFLVMNNIYECLTTTMISSTFIHLMHTDSYYNLPH